MFVNSVQEDYSWDLSRSIDYPEGYRGFPQSLYTGAEILSLNAQIYFLP
jgi:hypothetical protein